MKDLMSFTTSLKSSFLYSTRYIYYIVGGGGGGGGGGGAGGELLFFRIHVKGVIEFFCDAGGGAEHFV